MSVEATTIHITEAIRDAARHTSRPGRSDELGLRLPGRAPQPTGSRDMTTPNTDLAYRVLDHIDAHPEQWDQGFWWDDKAEIWTDGGRPSCGSAGCFAGWAVALSGGKMEPDRAGGPPIVSGLEDIQDGLPVSEAAADLLNVDPWTHGPEGEDGERYLFGGSNTRVDLGEIVEELFGPRPERAP